MAKLAVLVSAFILFCVSTEQGAPRQTKPRVYVPIVGGTGWQTCRDWKTAEQDFKLGYVIGQVEARAQLQEP